MGKQELRLIVLPGNVKIYFSILPFTFVFSKIEMAVQHKPGHFLAGYEFCNFYFGNVDIMVMLEKLRIGFVCNSFNFLRLPSRDIIDRIEHFFWCLADQQCRSEIFILRRLAFCFFSF